MPKTSDTIKKIEKAFLEAPKPLDTSLLHWDCHDDSDIASLYGVPHWLDLSDEAILSDYAALFFLSPAAFRHFLPAYMVWILLNPESSAAVVDHTIAALTPAEGDLRAFSLSKFTLMDDAQRAAIFAFLNDMNHRDDVQIALDYWRPGQEDVAAC
jgi:hypothetical protein